MAGPSNPSSPPANPTSPAKSPPPAKSPSTASPVQSPVSPTGVSSPANETVELVADEHPDGDNDDLGINMGAQSDTASLRSSILRYREENGRTYHAYKDGSYVLPNDDTENERLDLQHYLFLLTFDDRLQVAPFKKEPQRVLDAGCGTGIWSIEYADDHPEAIVTGVDLSPIQPAFVPPNCHFFVDDVEDDWNFSSPFDYVFARMMTGSVSNWSRFFKQAYENLTPGGTIELLDPVYPILSDDNTFPDSCALSRWNKLLMGAFAGIGRPIDSGLSYPQQLSDAGFVDITIVQEKWPSNRWPRDKKYKQLGIWNQENIINALAAFSLALFTRPIEDKGLGWSREETEALLAGVRNDIRNTNIHSYYRVHAVYARKPESAF